MNKLKKLFLSSSNMVVVQLFNYVAPLLIFPFLANCLSKKGFSEFIFALAIIQVLYLISEFGTNIFATKKVIDVGDFTGKKTALINGGVLLLKLVVVVVSTIFFILLIKGNTELGWEMFFPVFIAVLAYSFQPQWVFMASEQLHFITLSSLVGKLFYLLFIIIFIKSDDDLLLIFYLLAFSNCIALLISSKFYLTVCKRLPLFSTLYVLWASKESLSFVFSRIATIIPLSGGAIILGAVYSPLTIVSYVAVEQLYKAGRGIAGAVVQALFPFVVKTKDLVMFLKIVFFILVLISFSCFIFYLFSEEVLLLAFNLTDTEVINVYNIFLVTVIISFMTQAFGYPLFSIVNSVKCANKTSYYSLFIYITGASLLLYSDNITPVNVAILALINEIFLFCLRLMFFVLVKKRM